MTLINDIFENILKDITPTQEELTLINEIVKKLRKLLEEKARQLNLKYTKIEPQGSTGIKQTQLKNDFDIDLFVGLDYELYSPKYDGLSRNKLKKESKKDFLYLCNNWIKKSLITKEFHNPRLLYAEHPYVTVDYFINNIKIKVDIVLYFDLELEYINKFGPITAVDRSPWHGRFIKENLSPEQKNDVRLLKQFFKANHSYGDKSAVGKVGFIGYSAELLIYYYDNLQNLFNNFKFLKEKPSDYYNRTLKELGKIHHFQNDYIIITDPIDKNRNVASAISEKAYKYCNQRIIEFKKNPNKKFFFIEEILEVNISTVDSSLVEKIFIVELKNENSEIHYTINRDKLYAIGENIKANGEKEFSHAERFGKIEFEVYFEDDIEEYNLAIFCEKSKITKNFERRGPPIKEENHAIKFRKKNPNFFERDGFLWIESEREYTEFLKLLEDFVKNKIPENLRVVNISKSYETKTTSGKRAIQVLKNMILPFI
jgi:tRNA nucleotidyltransferase (CCA-adding enzyme)